MKKLMTVYGITVVAFGLFWALIAFLNAKQRTPEWLHFGSPVFFYALYALLFLVGFNLFANVSGGWQWGLRIVVPAIITAICVMLFAPFLIWLYVAQGGSI